MAHYWVYFERSTGKYTASVDAESIGWAIRRAAEMMAERHGGNVQFWIIDCVSIESDEDDD